MAPEHQEFTVGPDGEKRCDDCAAMVHDLVHVGSHQPGDFGTGWDDRGVQHAVPKGS